jgi:hypothetical protein
MWHSMMLHHINRSASEQVLDLLDAAKVAARQGDLTEFDRIMTLIAELRPEMSERSHRPYLS